MFDILLLFLWLVDDDEHYDEDDDDFLTGDHSSDKSGGSHHHDTDESEADYDEETDLGPTLGNIFGYDLSWTIEELKRIFCISDNFGSKLDGSDAIAGNELPIFLVEPQNSFVVRNRPAVLKCKAAHALQVNYIRYWIHSRYFDSISIVVNWLAWNNKHQL